MAVSDPIWPTHDGLDALWASQLGAHAETAKARWFSEHVSRNILTRPRVLIIGPVSPNLMNTLQDLKPALMIQAYPPIIGVRHGDIPALLMDTDLPPFANSTFDLVVLSFVIEFRTTPLALLSLAYEILRPQGHLLTFAPHLLAPMQVRPGHSTAYVGPDLSHKLRQAAFTPLQTQILWSNRARPLGLGSLACPQYPPKPIRGTPILARMATLLNQKRAGSVAASGEIGIDSTHDR